MNNNIDNNNNNNSNNNNDIIANPEPLQENEIQPEQKKEESKEKNDIKPLTNDDQTINYESTSKKKKEENPICNYTFSKMEVIENNNNNNNDMPNSSEKNPPVELNQQQKTEIPDIQINNDELISSNIKEEIQICEEKNVNESNENRMGYLTEKNKNKNMKDNYVPKSAKKKGDFYKLSLLTKEDLHKLDDIIRKKENKSHSKSNIKLNMENLHEIFNKMTYIENKENLGINLSLQDIETTKANFISQFEIFLSQENIEIINNFPVSTDEKNIHLFEQSNFWYLVISFLFYKNSNLSIYNILFLLEQYHIWAKDKNLEIFNSMKIRIKDYLSSHFSKEFLDQFLFMNKLNNFDEIFQKFESPNFYPELDAKNKISNEYKEIKVNDINFLYEKKDEPCKCILCTNDGACIQKVCDLNKSRIEIVNNSSMNLLKKEITKEDIIKKNNSCIMFHNNEELFYQGKSEKKSNTIFSKSKTILEDGGCFEFIRQPVPIPPATVPKEKKENVEDNAKTKNENEDKKIVNDEDKDILVELDKKNHEQENHEDNDINMDILDDDNPSKKSFKNISKSEKKPMEEQNDEEIIEIKSEGKEPNKNEDIIPIEKNEEGNNIEDETKNIKKEKKSRKGKSRKKNSTKINNKKKKDSITKERKEAEKEDVKDEPKEEEKEEKSVKKKRKSTNRSSLKKNKSKNCVKDEEKEEKEEKAESEIINIGSKSEKKLEMEPNINNSKRKKSKTPNKKKSRKH